jgi:hypothetical protein
MELNIYFKIDYSYTLIGARGSVMVEAVIYKPEGQGSGSQLGE